MTELFKKDYSFFIQKALLLGFGFILVLSIFLLITSSSNQIGAFPGNLFKGYLSNLSEVTGVNLPANYPQQNFFNISFDIVTMPIAALLLILFSMILLWKRLVLFLPFGLVGSLILLLYDTLSDIQQIDGLILPWIIFLIFATCYLLLKKFFKIVVPDKIKNFLFIPQLSLILLTLVGIYLLIVFYSIGAFSFLMLQMSFSDARYIMQLSDPNKVLVIGTYDKQQNEYKISNPYSNKNPFNDDEAITLEPK